MNARAQTVEVDGQSFIELQPGTRYFLDIAKGSYLQNARELHEKYVPESAVAAVIDNGGHTILVEYRIQKKRRVPTTFAALGTGHFWILPEGQSLASKAVQVFGTQAVRPQSFLEWAAEVAPGVLGGVLTGAETVKETIEAVKKSVGLPVAKIAIGAGVLLLLYTLAKRS